MSETKAAQQPVGASEIDPFTGGGEMGALMRATDWSQTKLGPVESWPMSLKAVLGTLLRSRFPMLLWWGPELLHLYNDAYRPILRDKHPASLAAPAAEVWAEVWDVAGPLARGVQAGGPATWMEDLQLLVNSGTMAEETYFTFSYSPVPAEGNTIGGVLNTVQETTTKVQGERQMRMLHELSARAASAKSADDAYAITAAVLATNDLDLPFVLVYSLDADRTEARLAAVGGLSAHDAPYKPERIALTGEHAGDGWPLAEALSLEHEVVVDDLSERFGSLPAGRFGARPERAIVLPLCRTSPGSPYAFLVAGLSPHRAFDDRYRRFFQATVDQVAAAIAAARAYEGERERAEALAEVDRSKTTFFSNVSHEFRTPLTLILGPVEDALSSGDKLSGENLQAVHRNAVRLLKLVNALLEFSRAEARHFEVKREPVDLTTLTAGLAGSFASVVDAAGLRLVVDCPPFPEAVEVDPSHWETIVLNLVSNAFKFTFEGEVGVGLRRRGDHVELRVWDTGTGIPLAELPHVFDRFHRVEGARGRSFEGTGIGLALVHELVTAHGGSVSVSSKPGEGTTFLVTIPVGSGHGEAAPRSEPRNPGRQGKRVNAYVMEAAQWATAHGSSARVEVAVEPTLTPPEVPTPSVRTGESSTILVVDDNPDLRRYLTRLLEPRWHVEAVTNGAEALAVARARPPDLILSDMMMPVMDGSALVRALRDDPKTRTIVVILLSARAGQEAVLDGLDTGADDYLVKPFAARELLTRVATHLEMARARRAAFLELQRTQAQLVQAAKMASLGELVAGIAHQINNPLAFAVSHLNTVSRIVEELKDKTGDNDDGGASRERALDRLREMRLGLERIRALVLKLRTFSRLDEGEEKEVSVSESIDAVLMILGHRIEDGIVVEKQLGEPDVVTCNPELFNQAIMNLASNAIDAMNGGGTLTIATRTEGSSYVMSVSDTGPGIPEAIRHRVLEPFFTTKPVGAGTGLGLSIAYSIVQKHGGTLELRARPEGGTEAIVRLPLARAVSPG